MIVMHTPRLDRRALVGCRDGRTRDVPWSARAFGYVAFDRLTACSSLGVHTSSFITLDPKLSIA